MTTQQTPEVPRRKIPKHMWNEIFSAEHRHSFLKLRDELIRIGLKHGFTENELERRGVIRAADHAKRYFEGGQA
jgi:hypothetical protein